MKRSVSYITKTAIIAALYIAFTVAFEAVSFGPVQFRVSELLTLLPIIFAEAVPGLTIGCFFSNFFFSSFGLWDMLLGTLATLLASIATRILRKNIVLATLPPMLFNALIVPLVWVIGGSAETVYYIGMLQILLSEFIICGLIGAPFTLVLKKAFLKARIIRPEQGKYIAADPYVREEKHISCINSVQGDNAVYDTYRDNERESGNTNIVSDNQTDERLERSEDEEKT